MNVASRAILCLPLISFALAWVATRAMIRVAPRIGFVDKPGHRKIHHIPKPLGGGVAIYLGIALPMMAALAYAWLPSTRAAFDPHQLLHALLGGIRLESHRALGVLLSITLMHLLGLWDDRSGLGPYLKLTLQLAIVALLVIGFDLRALTALDHLLPGGRLVSWFVTILWIAAITNAFNFLDNMDGLSAGIATVCATAFLITTLLIGQWFVGSLLALMIGSLLGFLCFNFPPARIFMGDSGSLLIGLLLGILTVRTTYLPPGESIADGWYALLAPVVVLAVPLYDLIVVSIIRLSRGKSPFVGDNNHFSHRLVARGMSRRTAVLCLYLVTAATSIAAILLPHVGSTFGAILIFTQTLLVLAVVALLEQHPLPVPPDP